MFEQFFAPQLIERGYQGTYTEVWRQWLESKGAPSITTPGMEMRWLGDLGYTGALQDRWRQFFLAEGLTGVLVDDARHWVVHDGGTIPEGDPIPDPLWDDVVFFWNGDLPDYEAVKGGVPIQRGPKQYKIISPGPFNGNAVQFSPTQAHDKNVLEFSVTPFELDATAMTVDCWGKTVDLGVVNFPTWMQLSSSITTAQAQYFGASDSRGFTTGGYYGFHTAKDGEGIPHDDWTHLAVVFDAAEVRIYSQGRLIGSSTRTAGTTPLLVDRVSLGGRIDTSYTWNFKGFLDEVRVTKGVRYTGETYTIPSGPVLVPEPPVEP